MDEVPHVQVGASGEPVPATPAEVEEEEEPAE